MKKILACVCVLCAAALLLCACGARNAPAPAETGGKLKIVTTFFPEYDWVMNVLGDKAENAEVTLLQKTGVDLHSFQPKTDDIITLANADVFIHIGGVSDKWVPDALRTANNADLQEINLLAALNGELKEEEMKPGMQPEEEAEEEEEEEIDEHVWLSLRCAEKIVGYLAEQLGQLDPDNAAAYAENAAAYAEKLHALDARCAEAVSAAPRDTVLFADRFAFRYFVDDYGIDYYAAFVGCSTETEANFQTVTFLAQKAEELALDCLLTQEGSQTNVAKTVIEAGARPELRVLELNSMQSVTEDDIAAGATYLSLMEKNVDVMIEALQ